MYPSFVVGLGGHNENEALNRFLGENDLVLVQSRVANDVSNGYTGVP